MVSTCRMLACISQIPIMNILSINILQTGPLAPNLWLAARGQCCFGCEKDIVVKCTPHSCLVVCVFVTHVTIIRFQRPCGKVK